MKLIFLDIDGVLNTCTTETPREVRPILPRCMTTLNKLMDVTQAKVVITSTWRMSFDTIIEIQALLETKGFTGEIVGMTDKHNIPFHVLRGNLIYKWLHDNADMLPCTPSEFNDYVILDDDSDILYWQRLNYFNIDGLYGLTDTIAYRVQRFFKRTRNYE